MRSSRKWAVSWCRMPPLLSDCQTLQMHRARGCRLVSFTVTLPSHPSRRSETTYLPPSIQTVIWGTDVNIARVMSQFKHFLSTFMPTDWSNEANLTTGRTLAEDRPLYIQRLEDLAASGGTALDVNCEHIRTARPELYTQLVTFPKEVIPACDAATHALFIDRFRDAQPEHPIQVSVLLLFTGRPSITDLRDTNCDFFLFLHARFVRSIVVAPASFAV